MSPKFDKMHRGLSPCSGEKNENDSTRNKSVIALGAFPAILGHAELHSSAEQV